MTTESELVSLIRQAVCAALPDNIVEHKNLETGAITWLDTTTNETQATHPFESSTKERLPTLRDEIQGMRSRRADRLAKISALDQGGVDLPAEAMAAYQRVVGLLNLLGPEAGSEEAQNWKSWPKRIAGTHPQAWVALVQLNGVCYYQRFGVGSDETTSPSPYDWASLEEITMQLHWCPPRATGFQISNCHTVKPSGSVIFPSVKRVCWTDSQNSGVLHSFVSEQVLSSARTGR